MKNYEEEARAIATTIFDEYIKKGANF